MQIINELPFSINFTLLGYAADIAANKNIEDKTYRVYTRIIMRREKSEISTGISIKCTEWDFNTGLLYPTTPYNKSCNNRLAAIKNRFAQIYNQLEQSNSKPSVKKMRELYRGKLSEHPDMKLLDFFNQVIDEKRQQTNEITSGTITNYIKSKNHLEKFLAIKGWTNISLRELSKSFIVAFEHYLLSTIIPWSEKPMSLDSAIGHIKKLRTVCLSAVEKELIPKDPFIGYKKKKNNKSESIIYLNDEEVQALKYHDFGGNVNLQRVRDFFLFSVYSAGLRYSDVKTLQVQEIRTDKNGLYWIRKKVIKTNEWIEVPMLEPAIEILNRYGSLKGDALPLITNQKINKNLKVIANFAGITKKLTFHVARHTFGTLACDHGVDIYTISKMLGHKSIRTTMIYAKISRKKLEDAAHKLNSSMNLYSLNAVNKVG